MPQVRLSLLASSYRVVRIGSLSITLNNALKSITVEQPDYVNEKSPLRKLSNQRHALNRCIIILKNLSLLFRQTNFNLLWYQKNHLNRVKLRWNFSYQFFSLYIMIISVSKLKLKLKLWLHKYMLITVIPSSFEIFPFIKIWHLNKWRAI